ncbi:MAG: penicillin-binding protein 1C [Verrucomicrobiales bacterium]|nr:penicillin-binding protein 1C [Verrucomicrobiales bacterium]
MKRILTALVIACFLGYGFLFYAAPLFFPLPAELERAPRGLLFTDREGRPIRRLLDGGLRADEPATFDEFPNALIEATLAAEDSRFFSHNGIDFIGIARALKDAAGAQEFVSGASTITQQTIKLYSPRRKRDFKTKIIEALTARKLEMFADKETILTAYLNKLPYGNQLTGTRAAARSYFAKPLGDLSVAESALLAGLPNKPSKINPWRNLEGAQKRQTWVLQRMAEEKFITSTRLASALNEELNLVPRVAQVFHAPHLIQLIQKHDREAVLEAEAKGTNITTTIDLDLQKFVESAARAELARLCHESKEANDLHAAVVVIENQSGNILALSGSRSFFSSRSGQVNGAWSPRSAGSTLKPFTYLLALQRNYTPATILADTPIEYVSSAGSYQPVNFDRRFNGPVSLRHALANSLNVPAVKLLNALGGPEILHHLLKEDLKLTSLTPTGADYGLGLTLGNAEVRLLELTNAYACLARLGEFRPVRMTKNSTQRGLGDSSVVFDRDAAWLIADILADEQARSEAFGLHSPLNLPFRTAAKTGTSTDFRDNWTIGFTPDYTVGVWVGRFNNHPLNQVSGARGAAPIFHRVMVRLHREREPRWYERPDTIVQHSIDRISGHRLGSHQLPSGRIRRELFIQQHLTPLANNLDYGPDGKTLLSLDYTNWWQSEANDLYRVAELTPIPEHAPPPRFQIISPAEGTVAFLDPDLPSLGGKFPLKISGSGREEIEWASETLAVENDGELSWLILEPGEHEVTACDRNTGREVMTRLSVESL